MKNKQLFGAGMRDGMPVCLGYIAVGFSIGIAAKTVGLNAFQGFLLSLFNNASACWLGTCSQRGWSAP